VARSSDEPPTLGGSLVAEFLGTFALVFIGAGAIVTNEWTKGAVGLGGVAGYLLIPRLGGRQVVA